LFLELLMKADKQGVDEGPVRDRVAELPEFIADRLMRWQKTLTRESPWAVV
jgi:hypothetical protein